MQLENHEIEIETVAL